MAFGWVWKSIGRGIAQSTSRCHFMLLLSEPVYDLLLLTLCLQGTWKCCNRSIQRKSFSTFHFHFSRTALHHWILLTSRITRYILGECFHNRPAEAKTDYGAAFPSLKWIKFAPVDRSNVVDRDRSFSHGSLPHRCLPRQPMIRAQRCIVGDRRWPWKRRFRYQRKFTRPLHSGRLSLGSFWGRSHGSLRAMTIVKL